MKYGPFDDCPCIECRAARELDAFKDSLAAWRWLLFNRIYRRNGMQWGERFNPKLVAQKHQRTEIELRHALVEN